jgi:hypothetical protein
LGTLGIPSPAWLAVIYSLALRFELHQCFLFLTFAGFNFCAASLAGAVLTFHNSGVKTICSQRRTDIESKDLSLDEHCPREVS